MWVGWDGKIDRDDLEVFVYQGVRFSFWSRSKSQTEVGGN